MTSSTPHPHSRDFERAERLGDDHVGTSVDTPLRPDAFLLDDQEKISRIEPLFREIMEVLGLDLTDDSLSGTPRRVEVGSDLGGVVQRTSPRTSTSRRIIVVFAFT